MAFNTVAAYQQEAKQLQTYPSGYQAIYCDIDYQGGVVTTPLDLVLGSRYCLV